MQALSRLNRDGVVQRVHKGLYYHPRTTDFGTTVPASSDVAALTTKAALHPSGLLAANVLGLSTQNPLRPDFATSNSSAPSAVTARRVHTDRPAARATLSREEGACLEFLRQRGRFSDLNAEATTARLLEFLSPPGRFERLVAAAEAEPPRVRAMLGALGEELGANEDCLARLRASLNAVSRFDFGSLGSLRNAAKWQARETPRAP